MYDTLFLENFDVSQLIKMCHTSYLCVCVVSCTSSCAKYELCFCVKYSKLENCYEWYGGEHINPTPDL